MITDQYYKMIEMVILHSKTYELLGDKRDLYRDEPRRFYVNQLKTYSEMLAVLCDYDEEKTGVLALAKGMVYAPFGKAGDKYLEKCAREENITLNKRDICKKNINKILQNSKISVKPDLLESIDALYEEDKNKKTAVEVQIVTVVDKLLEDVNLLKINNIKIEELLEQIAETSTRDTIEKDIIIEKFDSNELKVRREEASNQELKEHQKKLIDDKIAYYKQSKIDNDVMFYMYTSEGEKRDIDINR